MTDDQDYPLLEVICEECTGTGKVEDAWDNPKHPTFMRQCETCAGHGVVPTEFGHAVFLLLSHRMTNGPYPPPPPKPGDKL